MKKSLADGIEQYIKVLIARSENRQIAIQRAELAETFACVPSQITYVLSTRFTRERGYYIESHRGGRGFISIALCPDPGGSSEEQELLQFMNKLRQDQKLTEREMEMLSYLVRKATANLPPEYSKQVHAEIEAALLQMLKIESGRRGGWQDVM